MKWFFIFSLFFVYAAASNCTYIGELQGNKVFGCPQPLTSFSISCFFEGVTLNVTKNGNITDPKSGVCECPCYYHDSASFTRNNYSLWVNETTPINMNGYDDYDGNMFMVIFFPVVFGGIPLLLFVCCVVIVCGWVVLEYIQARRRTVTQC